MPPKRNWGSHAHRAFRLGGGLQFAQCLTSDLGRSHGSLTHGTGTAKVPFLASSVSSCLFLGVGWKMTNVQIATKLRG